MSGWFDKEDRPQPPAQRGLPGHSPDEHLQAAEEAMNGIQEQYRRNADGIQQEFEEHADGIQGKPGSEPRWPE